MTAARRHSLPASQSILPTTHDEFGCAARFRGTRTTSFPLLPTKNTSVFQSQGRGDTDRNSYVGMPTKAPRSTVHKVSFRTCKPRAKAGARGEVYTSAPCIRYHTALPTLNRLNNRHTTRCGSSTKPVAPSCYSLGHAQARLVTAWPAPSWHQPNHSAPTRERSKRTPCDIYDFLAFFFLFFFACFFYRGRSLSSGVRTGVGAAEGR